MTSLFHLIQFREKLMKAIFFICSFFSIFSLGLIMIYLFINGLPFINQIGFLNFIFGDKWAPLATNPTYGIFNMIIATVYVTAFSTIMGGALGVFTAIGLYKFVNKKIVKIISQFVDLLAGIPSVIYGLFGMRFIVPFVRDYIS